MSATETDRSDVERLRLTEAEHAALLDVLPPGERIRHVPSSPLILAVERIVAERVAARDARVAREALLAAAGKWQRGEWTALTPAIKATTDNAQRIIGAAQAVTDWLRDRAAEIAS